MFNIDLLKGRGTPIKTNTLSVMVFVITVIVPAVIALIMTGSYVHSRVIASIQNKKIANYQARIEQSPQALEFQKRLEKEGHIIDKSFSEISKTIGRYTQWSGILQAVAESVPDSMILTRLEVEQKPLKIKKSSEENPEKIVSLTVPVRTMHINISGQSQENYDKEVYGFRDKLLRSSSLNNNLREIRISRKSDVLENREIVCYEIDCIFKPSI